MKTTARVFPTQTNMTPTDTDAYYGPPDLFTPRYDQVLISATFSWDRPRAQNWPGPGWDTARSESADPPTETAADNLNQDYF